MINIIWFLMLAVGITAAASQGEIHLITSATIEGANEAVKIAIGLIGIISLWSGMMKIATDAGLMNILAKLMHPIASMLFPEIPKNHPAMGAILLSMSANILGLGNACTPLGIKAIEELQKINPEPESASNSMCTFLAITSSSLTIVPTTIIALRTAANSNNPTEIIGTTIAATLASTTAAVIVDRFLRKFMR